MHNYPIKHVTLVTWLTSLMLTACSPTSAPNTPNTSISKVSQPIPTEQCEQFRSNTAATLGIKASATIGSFKNVVTGEESKACIIEAKSTGLHFASPLDAMHLLRSVLFNHWKEEPAYQADGPTGTTTAFRDGKRLVAVSVNWDPAPQAHCPENQPISACSLKPEQKLYTITIQAAQK